MIYFGKSLVIFIYYTAIYLFIYLYILLYLLYFNTYIFIYYIFLQFFGWKITVLRT